MRYWLFWGPLLGLLVGCGSSLINKPSRYNLAQDSPLVQERDVAKIPDAEPVLEPLSTLGNQGSYTVNAVRYQIMKNSRDYSERGKASWYGSKFHGYHTSNGEIYNMFAMTAAHKTLPLPTYLRVTNIDNGKQVIVRVNDRGPFHRDRIVDLSYAAAVKLGYAGKGTANVQVKAIDPVLWQLQKQLGVQDGAGDIYLQVGAFASFEAADRVKSQLESALEAAVNIYLDVSRQPQLHKVQIGPLKNLLRAGTIQQKISKMGFGVPLLVRTSL